MRDLHRFLLKSIYNIQDNMLILLYRDRPKLVVWDLKNCTIKVSQTSTVAAQMRSFLAHHGYNEENSIGIHGIHAKHMSFKRTFEKVKMWSNTNEHI